MRRKIKTYRKINANFYYLIKILQRNKFIHTAKIASYAYEEFLTELYEKFNNTN